MYRDNCSYPGSLPPPFGVIRVGISNIEEVPQLTIQYWTCSIEEACLLGTHHASCYFARRRTKLIHELLFDVHDLFQPPCSPASLLEWVSTVQTDQMGRPCSSTIKARIATCSEALSPTNE